MGGKNLEEYILGTVFNPLPVTHIPNDLTLQLRICSRAHHHHRRRRPSCLVPAKYGISRSTQKSISDSTGGNILAMGAA